jgi:two-component system cell cycle response regulator
MKEEMIERIMSCPALPSLPAVAVRVLELTQRRDVSMDELASTIQNDQALAAKVLKTVNSSFYGLRRRCTTINGALVMLGLSTVKSLSLGFSLVSALNEGGGGGFDLVAYWRRGLYTAVAGKLLADRTRSPLADEVFLGGLLQDIGMMAMYQTLGKRYLRVIPIAGGDHRQLARAELVELEVQHPEIGAMLVERWKLPEELIAPIRYHERPTAAPPEHEKMVRCVAVGNIVHDVLTDADPVAALRRLHARAKGWFDCSAADAEQLVRQAADATREMSSLFRLETGAIAQAEEILERAQRQLKELSRTREAAAGYGASLESVVSDGDTLDPLTGSAGRMELLRTAERDFSAARERGGSLAVLTISIDAFDDLVRSHGAEHADIALVETAALLCERFEGGGAIVGRWADATFAVVVPDMTHDRALRIAADVRGQVETASRSWGIGAAGSSLTVSVGAASLDTAAGRTYPKAQQLLAASARAMEAAAIAGGNCVRGFVPRIAA